MIYIGTPHVHNSGYYRNDDTCSGGKKVEADIQSCSHCQAVIKMQSWKEEGDWCSRCSKPICKACGEDLALNGCRPFLQKLEQSLERDFHRAQFRKLAGLT